MAQLDANIFLQQQAPDLSQIGAGFERGLRIGDLMRQKKENDLAKEKQNSIDQAFKAGVITNPDGTTSFDSKTTIGQLMGIDPREAQKAEAQFAQQDIQKQQANATMLFQESMRASQNPEYYQTAVSNLTKAGVIKPGEAPPVFDAGFVKNAAAMAGNAKDYLDNLIKENESKEKNRIEWAKLSAEKAKGEAKGPKLTVGQEAADREVGKDFANAPSDQSSFDKNLQRLEDAKAMIEKKQKDFFSMPTSGRLIGRLPDVFTPEDNTFLRQEVQGAAQGGLKAALGTQFTEKEGERIMAASYDEKLSPEKNLEKINLAIKELKDQKALKDKMLDEFSKKGTVSQFKIPRSSQEVPPNQKPQTIIQNGFIYKLNPQTGEYE